MLLIPWRLKGVKYRALGAASLLRRNLLIYGLGGIVVPFAGIKLIDMTLTRCGSSRGGKTMRTLRPLLVLFGLLTVLTGIVYPLAVTGIGRLAFRAQASGSLVMRDDKVVGSSLIGQSFQDPKYFWGRVSATSPCRTMPPPPADRT